LGENGFAVKESNERRERREMEKKKTNDKIIFNENV
jgi:hypothetical protein